jgi:hypothetical protein
MALMTEVGKVLPLQPLVPYNPYREVEVNGIKRFENTKLQSVIDDAVKAVGDKHFAAVAHHVYREDGTQLENITKVSLVVRVGDSFSLAAGAYKDWVKGDLGAEAKAIWTP